MGQTINHNYSIETQYEVLVKSGRLPLTLMHILPHNLTAVDQHRVSEIFGNLMTDPNFPKYLKSAIEKVDDDLDAKTPGVGEPGEQLPLKPVEPEPTPEPKAKPSTKSKKNG